MQVLSVVGASIVGLWSGELEAPDMPQPIPVELLVESVADDGRIRGSMAVEKDHSPLSGSFDATEGELELVADFDDAELIRIALRWDGSDTLSGVVSKGDLRAPLTVSRTDDEPRFFHGLGFPVPDEIPVTVVSSVLEPEVGERVQRDLLEELEGSNAVGASVVVVEGGRILDVRCAGWEDLARDIPASGRTRYRWASLAKPLTAVATLQLVEDGRLDLERDVRELVPEFPDKGHTITAHQLLAHHAGIAHYGNGTIVATEREYDVPHPWADRILCLDLFRESPLIAEPGERFSYSTFGYMLLGAVVERAGGAPFEEQVQERILAPLGMRTMQPDYPWLEIPHRAVGYRGLRIGMATLDPELDVSWKLPAGGWISTVEDLGRFAAGLLGGELLEPGTRKKMFTSKVPADGRDPHYGYGVGVYRLGDVEVVSHSGQQSMASTFLLLCPEEDLGVGVLSNTANLETWRLARRVLSTVRSSRRE